MDVRVYREAQTAITSVIRNEAMRFPFLLESERLSPVEKEQYSKLVRLDTEIQQDFTVSENVLKENLFFAVLTGCLRVAKESIFTGLNNFRVISITNRQFDEYFGFSNEEVKTILDYYGFGDKHPMIKEWYDGYRFGNAERHPRAGRFLRRLP